MNCIGDVDNFFFSCSFSSIFTDLVFVFDSSSLKKLTVLFKTERLSKTLTIVQKSSSFRQTAEVYEVNKQIIKNRISEKRFMIDYYQENATFFSAKKKAALLRFVNHFVALGFSSRRSMLKEKAVLLFRKKNVDHTSDVNWSKKFLNRHLEYVSKFSRNLNQERHWIFETIVFVNWFDLYDRICLKFSIANGDQYNMNEKSYLMKMAKIVKQTRFFSLYLIWFNFLHFNTRIPRCLNSIWFNDMTFQIIFRTDDFSTKWSFVVSTKSLFPCIQMIDHESQFSNLFFFRDQVFCPLIIFRGKKIQKNWIDEWSYSIYEISNNDWTNNEAELTWLKKIFHFETMHFENRRLFLIDDHTFHVSMKFIEYCWTINIVFFCFSFHIIHYLQFFDIGCFESLITTYQRQLKARNRTDIVQIIELNFLTCLRKTKKKTLIVINIMSIWTSTDKNISLF